MFITPLKIVVLYNLKKRFLKLNFTLSRYIYIVGKKVIAVFTDRCLLKKRDDFLLNLIYQDYPLIVSSRSLIMKIKKKRGEFRIFNG